MLPCLQAYNYLYMENILPDEAITSRFLIIFGAHLPLTQPHCQWPGSQTLFHMKFEQRSWHPHEGFAEVPRLFWRLLHSHMEDKAKFVDPSQFSIYLPKLEIWLTMLFMAKHKPLHQRQCALGSCKSTSEIKPCPLYVPDIECSMNGLNRLAIRFQMIRNKSERETKDRRTAKH